MGKHLADIPPNDLVQALKLLYIADFFAILACVWSKTSFAVTLLRVMQKPWQKRFLWFLIITMNIAMVLTGILNFAQCSPVSHLWDFSIPAKCWDPNVQDNLALFSCGKPYCARRSGVRLIDVYSIFGSRRLHPFHYAVASSLETPDED
jgi:hypothetical protein